MEFSTLVSRISTGIRNMPLVMRNLSIVMRNLSIVVVTFAVAFVLTGILSCILDTLYELIIEYSLLFVLPVTLLTAWAIGKNTLTRWARGLIKGSLAVIFGFCSVYFLAVLIHLACRVVNLWSVFAVVLLFVLLQVYQQDLIRMASEQKGKS